jgi:Bacterial Ig-like domain (group 3)
VTQVVAGLVTPTVTLTLRPGTASFGSHVTFTATVSYPGGPVPTGSITISNARNGSETYGVAILNNGVGVVMNSTIPVGSYNLVATI